jgi:hypothetical protein
MRNQIPTFTPEDVLNGAIDRSILTTGAALDDPVILVDLNGRRNEKTASEAAAKLSENSRIAIGLRTDSPPDESARILAESLDTSICSEGSPDLGAFVTAPDPDADLADVLARIGENPYAAILVAQVLKLSANLSIPAALDIESLAYSTLLGSPDFERWLRGRGSRPLPPPAPDAPVKLQRDGNMLRITLNRLERRNAYGAEVRDGLVSALQVPVADPTVERIVLDGVGPSFCAGGDLDEFGTTPDLTTAHLIRTRAGAARLMALVADRIEVNLHGSCIGAGIEIPAFAHWIRARPDAVFKLPEVGMGVLPGAGGTVSIPRRIGRWRAYHLFVSGRQIDVYQAFAWGLVDEVV